MTDRELDALIAEKVFNLPLRGERPCGFYDGDWCVFDPEGSMGDSPPDIVFEDEGGMYVVPHYVTSVADAFLVVNKMATRGFLLQLVLRAAPNLWMAGFGRSFRESASVVQAEGAGRAICLAALQTLDVRVKA